jgi:hypothetical protein
VGKPIAGLESLTSNVSYINTKLDENMWEASSTNTDGGIRQCYEKLPGGGTTGILTQGYTDPTLPRMIIMLTDGAPTVRYTDTLDNTGDCACPGAGPICNSCPVEAATKRGELCGMLEHFFDQQQQQQRQHAT